MLVPSHTTSATHRQEINPMYLDRHLGSIYGCKLRSIQDLCQNSNMIMPTKTQWEYLLLSFQPATKRTKKHHSRKVLRLALPVGLRAYLRLR